MKLDACERITSFVIPYATRRKTSPDARGSDRGYHAAEIVIVYDEENESDATVVRSLKAPPSWNTAGAETLGRGPANPQGGFAGEARAYSDDGRSLR